MRGFLRRMIVRASPTCTLWVADHNADLLLFRFNRHWVITAQEYVELS
jgi:hypothetical protein